MVGEPRSGRPSNLSQAACHVIGEPKASSAFVPSPNSSSFVPPPIYLCLLWYLILEIRNMLVRSNTIIRLLEILRGCVYNSLPLLFPLDVIFVVPLWSQFTQQCMRNPPINYVSSTDYYARFKNVLDALIISARIFYPVHPLNDIICSLSGPLLIHIGRTFYQLRPVDLINLNLYLNLSLRGSSSCWLYRGKASCTSRYLFVWSVFNVLKDCSRAVRCYGNVRYGRDMYLPPLFIRGPIASLTTAF